MKGNQTQSSDFLRVLLALKDNIMKDLHCCEIGIVKSIDNTNVICEMLYDNSVKIQVFCPPTIMVQINDLVVINFTDNFIKNNYLKLENGNPIQNNQSKIKHDFNNGVIIVNLTQSSEPTPTNPYPVGAIYASTENTSPASIFGGTWERIQNRFLFASGVTYTPGSTGGEFYHTLTVDEMPSHNHTIHNPHSTTGANQVVVPQTIGTNSMWAESWTWNPTGNAGGGQPHNNMPPYLVVNMWKRIS